MCPTHRPLCQCSINRIYVRFVTELINLIATEINTFIDPWKGLPAFIPTSNLHEESQNLTYDSRILYLSLMYRSEKIFFQNKTSEHRIWKAKNFNGCANHTFEIKRLKTKVNVGSFRWVLTDDSSNIYAISLDESALYPYNVQNWYTVDCGNKPCNKSQFIYHFNYTTGDLPHPIYEEPEVSCIQENSLGTGYL